MTGWIVQISLWKRSPVFLVWGLLTKAQMFEHAPFTTAPTASRHLLPGEH